MGWNQIEHDESHPLLNRVPDDSHTYFVHSYYCIPTAKEDIVALTNYGRPFTSIVSRGNVHGIQFHPEKSQKRGLQLLRKDLNLKVSPLGNPGMPMPMGMDKWFPTLGTALPGMESVMSGMMKSKMKSKGVASVADLREMCQEADVKLIACQMTVDLFDLRPEDLVDGIDYAGAATFFEFAGHSDICLFV